MHTRPKSWLVGAAVVLVVAVGGLSASARGQSAGNAATDWNAIASASIMSTAGQPPHAAVLSLAMVQGAVYDAVNAIDGRHQPYLVTPAADPSYSKEAAASTPALGRARRARGMRQSGSSQRRSRRCSHSTTPR